MTEAGSRTSRGEGWVQIDFPRPDASRGLSGGATVRGDSKTGLPSAIASRLPPSLARGDRSPLRTTASRFDPNDPDAFLRQLSVDDADRARKLQFARSSNFRRESRSLRMDSRPGWERSLSRSPRTGSIAAIRCKSGKQLLPMHFRSWNRWDYRALWAWRSMRPEQQRRVKLAEWITHPANPLTARVMVNRLWHYIFGLGIVDTPSDFGGNGAVPSNPALLDWLADEFVRSGWSVKHMQRLILLSRTFRQSAAPRPDGMAVDADARLLWRFPPRRMEAEAIRDCILATSGALDLRMGGPGFFLQIVEEDNVYRYFPKEQFGPDEFRRMVYLNRIRQEQDSVFGSFDCPSGNQVMPTAQPIEYAVAGT